MKKNNVTDLGNFDIELFVGTEILDVKSLHYGLWTQDQRLNLEDLHEAQERYTVELEKIIPKKAKRILDVGSGIGDVSRYLKSKGYEITAISPDKNHEPYYSGTDINFHLSAFEDFSTSEKFDEYYLSRMNPFYKLFGKIAFRGKIKKAQELIEYYDKRLDPSWYKKNVEYWRLLLKKR